ncbi:MAG: heavy metal-binding domain-containing protein [Granulosicoccaceae bacterium]
MSNVLVFLALLLCGWFFGRRAEKRHYKSIIERELEFNALPAIASRIPPADAAYDQQLVAGSTVVSSDYFKSITAAMINIFGGEVKPFEALIDRARRESILRMKAEAKAVGADMVFNIKMETSQIAAGRTGAIEVLAYGTALIPRNTVKFSNTNAAMSV